MDDMTAFERQVAGEFVRRAGPVRPVHAAAISTAITTTHSPKWRFQSMFSAMKFVVAGAIVALFGGFLLSGFLNTEPSEVSAPAASTDSPAHTTTEELLSGMVTEEVGPGVYRVVSDGHRALADRSEGWWMDGTWADGEGTVWFSRSYDLFRLGDPASHALPDGMRLGLDADVAIAPDGVLWVAEAMPAAGLWSFDGSRWLEVDEFADRFVRGVEVTPDGTVWVVWCPDTDPEDFEACKERTRVSRDGEDGWIEVARPDGHAMPAGRYSAVHFFAVGPDRQPWISSLHSGLLRYDGEGWTVVDPAGAAPYKEDAIIDVGLDGTVWAYQRSIATGEAYLSRLADGVWTVFGEADGVPPEPFGMQGGFEGFIRAAPDGSVWLTKPRDGGYGQLLRFDGSIWTELLEGRSPLSIAIAADGSAWVEAKSEDEISLYVITSEAVAVADAVAVEETAPVDTSTGPDLLPGVGLVTEEVEPGVYRVLSDGVDDLSDIPDLEVPATMTSDGECWAFLVGGECWFNAYGMLVREVDGEFPIEQVPDAEHGLTFPAQEVIGPLPGSGDTGWLVITGPTGFQGLLGYGPQGWTRVPYAAGENGRVLSIETGGGCGVVLGPARYPGLVGPDGTAWVYTLEREGLHVTAWDGDSWSSFGPVDIGTPDVEDPCLLLDAAFGPNGTMWFTTQRIPLYVITPEAVAE